MATQHHKSGTAQVQNSETCASHPYLYAIPTRRDYQVREPREEYNAGPTTEEDLATQATKLCDQMNDLYSLNSYLYLSVEGLLENIDLVDKEALHGLWLHMRWLREQSGQVKTDAKRLHTTIIENSATKGADEDTSE